MPGEQGAPTVGVGGQVPACDAEVAGFVGMRRLTNAEYDNVIRDLFGLDASPSKAFPEEPRTAFFANIAASLGTDEALARLYFETAGSVLEQAFSTARARIVTCDEALLGGEACAARVLGALGLKAFRRPLRPEELEGFVGLYRANRSSFPVGVAASAFDESLKAALQAMLISPQFLFQIIEPAADRTAVKALDGYELAARLSFFLWGSVPDAVLFADAASGTLLSAAVLAGHVERMLEDPRAAHLVDTFGQQWLKLENLSRAAPDPKVYPSFDETLRVAMANESRLLLADIFQRDASPYRVLDADYTYVDARLAAHYALPAPAVAGFQRVSLSGTGRTGLLTHAGLLTVTARPTESSIVQRGLWTLDRILCAPVGAPPADATAVEPTPSMGSTNPRTSLEAHASKPACAACHNVIDPAGFGLEGFDGIGRARTRYPNGDVIDARGQFPGGEPFDGAVELAAALKQGPKFSRCFTRHLMTFALGRTLSSADRCAADRLASATVAPEKGLSEVVKGLVASPQFLKQSPGAQP